MNLKFYVHLLYQRITNQKKLYNPISSEFLQDKNFLKYTVTGQPTNERNTLTRDIVAFQLLNLIHN